jgi:hypothetical protein
MVLMALRLHAFLITIPKLFSSFSGGEGCRVVCHKWQAKAASHCPASLALSKAAHHMGTIYTTCCFNGSI